MIGVYARDIGGLQTLGHLVKHFPEYDYIFLSDKKHYEAYQKYPGTALKRGFKILERLFDQGSEMVLIVSNLVGNIITDKWNMQYPEKPVVTITIPGIEKTIAEKHHKIGILATQGSIVSGTYNNFFKSLGGNKNALLHFVIASGYSKLIEEGFEDKKVSEEILKQYISQFPEELECIILGCAYFPYTKEDFVKYFNKPVLDIIEEGVKYLGPFLEKNPELHNKISKNKKIKFYTTDDIKKFEHIGSKVYKRPIIGNLLDI